VTEPRPGPWIGSAYRHIRANAGRDVLDFTYAGAFARNRWNEPGEPTLYLAGDPGVLVAEWGRQLGSSFSDDVAASTIERIEYRLHLRLERVLDLRVANVSSWFGLDDPAVGTADREVTRAAAARIRATTDAQALLVPSVAFLDDLSRWNLVVFLERMPAETHAWIQRVELVGPLRWR
jgi:RES domain-containing protein